MKIGNLEVYGIIYKITNLFNNKIYIGQTIQGFNKRYSSKGKDIERVYNHFKSCKTKNYFYNEHLLKSIEKYGINNFSVSNIFDIAFSKEELDIKEKLWISIYDSTNQNKGYNIAKGGNDSPSNFNPIICLNSKEVFESSREACRKYNIEPSSLCENIYNKINYVTELRLTFMTCDEYKKSSQKSINEKLYKSTIEYRSKVLSEAHIGKQSDEKHPMAKRIICLNTLEIFNTIKEAMQKYKNKGLEKHLRKRCKSSGKNPITNEKLVWAYYDDYLILSKEEIKNKIISIQNKNYIKSVEMIYTGL